MAENLLAVQVTTIALTTSAASMDLQPAAPHSGSVQPAQNGKRKSKAKKVSTRATASLWESSGAVPYWRCLTGEMQLCYLC